MPQPLSVIVVQMGARRNYTYARVLHERGALAALHSDFCHAEGSTSIVTQLVSRSSKHSAGAVRRRTVTGVPAELIHSFPLVNFVGAMARPLAHERRYMVEDIVLGARCSLKGLGEANVVLNTTGNGGPFLAYAKRQGLKIVSDIVITPVVYRTLAAERAAFPDWEQGDNHSIDTALYERRIAHLIALSDVLLCPSDTVVDGLRAFPGFDEAKVRVLPYPVTRLIRGSPHPLSGRVLFAGEAGLRKGIHYLAAAAKLLRKKVPEAQVVVAGSVTEANRLRPETSALTFRGHLDRERMDDELLGADLFCLPSLAEGSAGGIFEALSAGWPIVATRSAGSVVVDGREGFIVPERDPEATAEALARVIQDRALRAAMSAAATAAAERHSLGRYGSRLCEILTELLASTKKTRC